MTAPLSIFAFTRVDTLIRVLASLSNSHNLLGEHGDRPAYAFIDEPRNDAAKRETVAVRESLETYSHR